MSIESRFPSTEAMEQMVAMGMEEGLTEAVGQIDAILAEDGAPRTEQHDHDDRATTHTLDVPGATLTYDVRKADQRAPVCSDRFADGRRRLRHAAGHFADRTVVTYDPRGVERSHEDRSASQSTPEQHADDVHRIIEELGVGPVDLFASSGGAVNALALVSRGTRRTCGRWWRTSRRSPRSCPTASRPWRPPA